MLPRPFTPTHTAPCPVAFTPQITLASDFLWHWNSREATATVGYDCVMRQCRLRGE